MKAEKTVTVTDQRGLRVRIVAGRAVPDHLADAYANATKAKRAPDKDKAQRAPSRSK